MSDDPIRKHRPASILPVHAKPSEIVVIHWHGPSGELVQRVEMPVSEAKPETGILASMARTSNRE